MTSKPGELNKLEIWIAERAVPIFIVIAVLIVLGAGVGFYTYNRSSEAAEKVEVLRPQVTRINQAICDRHSLESEVRAHRCAERIRIGLINCRHSQPCYAAYLALATLPALEPGATEEGGAPENPSHAAQQPSLGHPGHPGGGHHGGGPSPSPGPPPAPQPSPGPNPSEQGEEAPQGSEGGSTSGPAVEVCAPAITCVGVEVGFDH